MGSLPEEDTCLVLSIRYENPLKRCNCEERPLEAIATASQTYILTQTATLRDNAAASREQTAEFGP